MDKEITIKGKRARDVSNLDWKKNTNFDWKDAVSVGAMGIGSIAGDDPVFSGIIGGAGMGSQYGLFGALAGAGFGLLNGIKQRDAQDIAERRQENLNQYSQDRAITQALRADWISKSNPVMAAQNGGNVEIQAMVAPGETIITEDGRVVRVKGKGNKDIVPWTDGPATVLGNLKMHGTGMKYKDFGKTYFKETKENVKEAPGNFGARAAIGKILANMQEKDKIQQGVKQKTATVTGKTLKNLGNAQAPEVPAAFEGDIIPKLGQSLALGASITERFKPADSVSVRYNPMTNTAARLIRQNTYDYVGGMRDINQLNRAMTYNTNAMGNTTGVNTLSRIAAHTQSLKGIRDVRRDYSIAQANANQKFGEFLYNAGAADVAAENLRDDLQARNEAAAFKNRQSAYKDIADASAIMYKDATNKKYSGALLELMKPYLKHGVDETVLNELLTKLQ